MASLYKRDRSPFYWLKFRDAAGHIQQLSTKCRINFGDDERRARRMEAEYTLKELSYAKAPGGGWLWVTDFLNIRYTAKPLTHERYTAAWETLKLFLDERQLENPAQVLRNHCFDYISWRKKPEPRKGKFKVCHNTALYELAVLRLIIKEAIVRGMCAGNPCVSLGIEKAERKLKPEFTDADRDLIRGKIPNIQDPTVRHMLTTTFEIGCYQGCRLKETRVDVFRDVDLNRMTITFKTKGRRDFTTALHPKLVPLFQKLRDDGRRFSWDPPQNSNLSWAAKAWFSFLTKQGIKKQLGAEVCFHCTRVTAVTRLARANVSITKAKNFIGHASTTIHHTYQRLKPEDVADCTEALG